MTRYAKTRFFLSQLKRAINMPRVLAFFAVDLGGHGSRVPPCGIFGCSHYKLLNTGVFSPSWAEPMARLEDLTRGASIKRILPDCLVDVKWHGSAVVKLTCIST